MLENPSDGLVRAIVAYAYARLGQTERAKMEIVQAAYFRPTDATVVRLAVQIYEILNQREKSLDILAAAPPDLLSALNRLSDLAGLREDPRFIELLTKNPKQ